VSEAEIFPAPRVERDFRAGGLLRNSYPSYREVVGIVGTQVLSYSLRHLAKLIEQIFPQTLSPTLLNDASQRAPCFESLESARSGTNIYRE
jgi:hypothetical protein